MKSMLLPIVRGITRGLTSGGGGGGGGGGGVPVMVEIVETVKDGFGNSILCTAPATINAGEVLYLHVSTDMTSGGFDALSGWTLVGQGGDAGSDAKVAVYVKEATGAETDVTVAWAGGSQAYAAALYCRITGADGSSIVNVSNFVADGGTSKTKTIPEIETTNDNCLVLGGLATDGGDMWPWSTSSTGWSITAAIRAETTGSGTAAVLYEKEMPSAGLTGDIVTVTTGEGDGSAYYQVALNSA